jgi:hypothetical protein
MEKSDDEERGGGGGDNHQKETNKNKIISARKFPLNEKYRKFQEHRRSKFAINMEDYQAVKKWKRWRKNVKKKR